MEFTGGRFSSYWPDPNRLSEFEIPDIWGPPPPPPAGEEPSVSLISHQAFAQMARHSYLHDAVYRPVPERTWRIYRRNDGVEVLARTVRWTFTDGEWRITENDLLIVTGAVANRGNARKAKREAHLEYRVHCMVLRHLAYLGASVEKDATFKKIADGLCRGGEPLVMKNDLMGWELKIVCGKEIISSFPTNGITDPPDFLEMHHQWPMAAVFWEIEADQESIEGIADEGTETPIELERRIEGQAKLFEYVKNPGLHWPSTNQGLTDEIRKIRLYHIQLVYAYEGLWYLVKQRWSSQEVAEETIMAGHPYFKEYRVRYLQAKELFQVPMGDVATLLALHEEHLRLQSLVNQPLYKNDAKLVEAYRKVQRDPKKIAVWRKKNEKLLRSLLDPAFAAMKERLGPKWDPINHPHHKALEDRVAAQSRYREMLG